MRHTQIWVGQGSQMLRLTKEQLSPGYTGSSLPVGLSKCVTGRPPLPGHPLPSAMLGGGGTCLEKLRASSLRSPGHRVWGKDKEEEGQLERGETQGP